MKITEYIDKYNSLSTINFEKELNKQIMNLHYFHLRESKHYKNILINLFGENTNSQDHIKGIPFIPVDIFKKFELISCKKEEIFKILTSSGTTSQIPSKIFLDRDNVKNQSKALSKIFTSFTGLNRPNILIVDNPNILANRKQFSARTAGVIGFRSLCKKAEFALNNNFELDYISINKFLDECENKPFLIFGFTSIIYNYLLKKEFPEKFKKKFVNSVLLHGGGWKKLQKLSISHKDFNDLIFNKMGVKKVCNYYGMVEQTGSIFMECEKGFLHTNPLATVLARSQEDLSLICETNKKGIAQVLSVLPSSYPGHSLLTDDIIEIKHFHNCPCGRNGISFLIHGRIAKSEIRGCSDIPT